MNTTIKFRLVSVLLFSVGLASCKKFIQLEPQDSQLVKAIVFESDKTATAAITGIYSSMINNGTFASGGIQSVTALGALSADELFYNPTSSVDMISFNKNEILPSSSAVSIIWKSIYFSIYGANAALEGLENSTAVSSPVKAQLKGEAKFVRALCYFYLVNLFGEVPLVTTIDYEKNALLPKSTVDEVYTFVTNDLLEAQSLLSNSYVATGRVRPNKGAATALLARVYLYKKEWAKAAENATAVIDNGTYILHSNASINTVFKSDSKEAIWQLQPIGTSRNTNEGSLFILTAAPSASKPFSLTTELLNAFEAGDDRRVKWVGSIVSGAKTYHFPHKYKIVTGGSNSNPAVPLTEYSMVLRLAEQYLVRAEARAHLNDISGAQSDINAIRNRALLPNTTASDQATLLAAIAQERRAEFFAEWGHRWLDLKRTDQADAVLAALKSPFWQTTDVLYPIPQTEVDLNPNIGQNLGY